MKKVSSLRYLVGAGVMLFVAGFSANVYADGVEDFYYQLNQSRFFDLPQNARTLAMAGSSVATSMDSSSVVGNPAGLGFMKDAEVSGTYFYQQTTGNDIIDYSDVEQRGDGGNVLAAFPIVPYKDALPEYGNIGFGWTGFRGYGDDSADADQNAWRLHLAYAKAINDSFSLGYNFSYMYDRNTVDGLPTAKMNDGIRQAIGAQYKLSADTTFGLSTSYGFGSEKLPNGLTFDGSSRDRIRSWAMEGGVAQKALAGLWTASIGYTGYWQHIGEDANAWSFRLGAEYPVWSDWLKLRAGYRYQANMGYKIGDDENAKYNAVSFGAGVNVMKWFDLDYAAEYRAVGDGDWSHYVTLVVPFSLCNN